MQGTAADLIKLAMVAVQDWLDENRRQSMLIMQVHDELVLEVPENELDGREGESPRADAECRQARSAADRRRRRRRELGPGALAGGNRSDTLAPAVRQAGL